MAAGSRVVGFEALSQFWGSDVHVSAFLLFIAFWQLFALLSVPSVLLRRRGNPSGAFAWLLALFTLPALGGIAWWAFGRTSLHRKRLRRQRRTNEYAGKSAVPAKQSASRFTAYAGEEDSRCVFPSTGNQVELLIDGAQAFPAMHREIQEAKRSVFLLFYIWRADEAGTQLRDLLVGKARQGVQVKVLVDAWGADGFNHRFAEPLLEAGAEVGWFLPSKVSLSARARFNFINHRKIIVVDQRVGFTGGMNVGDEYVSSWRDLMVRVHGPVVEALLWVFLDDWYFATGKAVFPEFKLESTGNVDAAVVASGPDSEEWMHDAFFLAYTQAKERLWLVTPYFIPPPALLTALRTAARRGVDVRVVVPRDSDVVLVKWASRSYYKELVDAGVKMFEYTGPMLHAKAFLVDYELACVGTANVDSRSLRLSFEVGCFFASEDLNAQLAAWHLDLVAHSVGVNAAELANKGRMTRLVESAAHLLSPIL